MVEGYINSGILEGRLLFVLEVSRLDDLVDDELLDRIEQMRRMQNANAKKGDEGIDSIQSTAVERAAKRVILANMKADAAGLDGDAHKLLKIPQSSL